MRRPTQADRAVESRMAEGYLYALDNTSMHGVYKVGCTTRNPFDRARELRTTGVPSDINSV